MKIVLDEKEILEKAKKAARHEALMHGGKEEDYLDAKVEHARKVATMDILYKHGLQRLNGNKLLLLGSKRQPMYLAKIVGLHPRFLFDRQFVPCEDRTCDFEFELEKNTYYAWKDSQTEYYGYFDKDGDMQPLSKMEMLEIFSEK